VPFIFYDNFSNSEQSEESTVAGQRENGDTTHIFAGSEWKLLVRVRFLLAWALAAFEAAP